jgi:U3 small nucleolar RNA-associated protein 25
MLQMTPQVVKEGRSAKRRKLDQSSSQATPIEPSPDAVQGSDAGSLISSETLDVERPDEIRDSDDNEQDGTVEDPESGEELAVAEDSFEQHVVQPSSTSIRQSSNVKDENVPQTIKTVIADGTGRTSVSPKAARPAKRTISKVAELDVKQRLTPRASELVSKLNAQERDVATAVFDYRDVVVGSRTVKNSANLRDICILHSLNHVFKTRDRVLKNNAKLSQASNAGLDLDLRDQGFTRPKVLLVLPTKQSCVRFVESIVQYSAPEQQEYKSRFLETFSREDTDDWLEKPEDFRELFGGNQEEDFRIGLKFTRKTIKYFSGFYNSDIIICSPLGLFRSISSPGGKNEKKPPDADFLSSIEIAIIDNATALQMQNWQHVGFIFEHLNQLPKESHGCDFSRIRSWYLDGLAKHVRQTIILSSYVTPEINRLVTKYLHNIDGRVKYVPTYRGVITDVSTTLPVQVTQTFVRFESRSALVDGDARFKYFCSSILPQISRDKSSKGVLVFIPNYADFTRLRNHLTNTSDGSSIAFGSVSDYTPIKESARARSYLLSGRNSMLLYTERAHHHFRYSFKGVRKVIFYGLPENPIFWKEVVGMLGINRDLLNGTVAGGKGNVRAMFSKWDAMKLERVVGSERVGRLLSEKSGDVFDFV